VTQDGDDLRERLHSWIASEQEAYMFKRILVCLDGSGSAEQILAYAREQALAFGAQLVLLQVVPQPVAFTPGIPGTVSVPAQTDAMIEVAKQASSGAKDYLEELAAPLRERGLRVETVSMIGRAGDTIVDYASKNNIDLIAIATHGRSGLGRAVFGSVADQVVRESGLPILLIRPQEQENKG
jgi:nucleotide-binding universal stress UspA family protein